MLVKLYWCKEGSEPIARHKPVPADQDHDIRMGIIEPVPIGMPVNWLSKMVVAPQKDGSPHRTVDLQNMNAATKSETPHHEPHELVVTIPNNRYKSVLDVWNGYHSLKLAKDATSFITEWCRYRYCRAL